MKSFVQLLIAFIVFIASYFFTYWVPFSIVRLPDGYGPVRFVLTLVVAINIAIYTWKKLDNVSDGLAKSIFKGGIIVGSSGFLFGFVGPIIFNSNSNLGPLVGIFLTGPLGFIVGLIGGGISWKIRSKKVGIPIED